MVTQAGEVPQNGREEVDYQTAGKRDTEEKVATLAETSTSPCHPETPSHLWMGPGLIRHQCSGGLPPCLPAESENQTTWAAAHQGTSPHVTGTLGARLYMPQGPAGRLEKTRWGWACLAPNPG